MKNKPVIRRLLLFCLGSVVLSSVNGQSNIVPYDDKAAFASYTTNRSNEIQVMSSFHTLNPITMKAVNKNAPVYSQQSISIQASPEKIWSVLTNINDWSRWQKDISNPRLNGPLTALTTFDWKTGGAKIHSTLHTVDPTGQFGWTGKTFGMFAIHNWTLTKSEGMVTVSVEESLEGFFARLLKKSFNKNLKRDMRQWLEQLKTESER